MQQAAVLGGVGITALRGLDDTLKVQRSRASRCSSSAHVGNWPRRSTARAAPGRACARGSPPARAGARVWYPNGAQPEPHAGPESHVSGYID